MEGYLNILSLLWFQVCAEIYLKSEKTLSIQVLEGEMGDRIHWVQFGGLPFHI